jgi:hypothetical protein
VEIRLLEAAKEDLREGYRFYEAQSEGLGDYRDQRFFAAAGLPAALGQEPADPGLNRASGAGGALRLFCCQMHENRPLTPEGKVNTM